MTINFIVFGSPAAQGSKKFVGMNKQGHGIMVEMSKKLKPWREDVKRVAEQVRVDPRALVGNVFPLDGPLVVRMVFTLPKPVSSPKRRRVWPMKTPDLSKLARSTEDALTQAGLWRDDARVVEYERLAKVYPREDPEALDAPGVRIEIRLLAEQQVSQTIVASRERKLFETAEVA